MLEWQRINEFRSSKFFITAVVCYAIFVVGSVRLEYHLMLTTNRTNSSSRLSCLSFRILCQREME